MRNKQRSIKELRQIPGIGKSIAEDLWDIGITSINDLKGKDPEKLYDKSNKLVGVTQDRCLLYTFRCAIYYADTPEGEREPEKLKWWNWQDNNHRAKRR